MKQSLTAAQEEGAPTFTSALTPVFIERRGAGSPNAPLWLITFTDIMALMLTFFVMLYAMAVPEEVAWEEARTALSDGFAPGRAGRWGAGPQDAVSIPTHLADRALDLRYLAAIMQAKLDASGEALRGAELTTQKERLVLSLPADLLFEVGSAEISEGGKRALWDLSMTLSRIGNRIALVGHTDPRPLAENPDAPGAYTSNRALSLARAIAVSGFMHEVGYARPAEVHGAASARFWEGDAALPPDVRMELARRVDIVILDEAAPRLATP